MPIFRSSISTWMQEGAQISEGQNYGKDRTTASLIQGAQVVVPRDSGPAHLAAAVDTPPGVLIWVAEKHGCPQSGCFPLSTRCWNGVKVLESNPGKKIEKHLVNVARMCHF